MEKWNCILCSTEMNIQSRTPHLLGKRHTKRVLAQSKKNPNPSDSQTLEAKSNYVTSETIDNEPVLALELQIAPSTYDYANEDWTHSDLIEVDGLPAMILVWECKVCNCIIPQSSKPAHLVGINHVQRLLSHVRLDEREDSPNQHVKQKTAAPPKPQPPISGYAGSHIASYHRINSQFILGVSDVKPDFKNEAQSWTYPNYKSIIPNSQKVPPNFQSSTSHAPTPPSKLDEFFLSFSGFSYDPSVPPTKSYQKLMNRPMKWHNWNSHSEETWKEYRKSVFERYQKALLHEFNLLFGTQDKIESWHALCRAVRVQPLPPTRKECEEAIRDRHVNIIDLIQWAREKETGEVTIFTTVKKLSDYSINSGKIFRKDQLEAGVVLRYLLRPLFAAQFEEP